ncbi:flagellar biosynthetic protein FliR [Neorhizobium sp. NCHU2750]|uniref:flagellar biosynthetic protein FliR n=1 Tax=Neorhizobium sp. NCHU2750 TaxID=1825976 RepID=UPI000E761F0B|nr:flagellar biosynthesis protein [Neorhizobium sp. NCHU2750]
MIPDPQGAVMALFLAFCRIGGCLMVMPGFSSARLPMQIRLFIALALSLALLPMFWDTLYPPATAAPEVYLVTIFSETITGVVFGMVARIYSLGIQFAGSIMSMAIAFNSSPTGDIFEDSSDNNLTSLLQTGALFVLFILDFHHYMIKAVAESYTTIPVGTLVGAQKSLISVTDALAATFKIMLRLASPFILYGMLFNVVVGMINKLAPQIPLYFISTPYALAGGILLVYFTIAALLDQFADGFFVIFNAL